ncbi:MAG: hypothetical protein JNK61_11950, partial [Bacteroidia bacterium]|nr:hypothetical protein [Bacteroidia bacterium]
MKKVILLCVSIALCPKMIFSQSTRTPNTWGLTTDYLGWDATAGSPQLNIRTTNSDAINFYTNFGSFASTRMRIMGGNSATGGFVGIGYNHTPNFQLDVLNDINIQVNAINNAYRLNGVTVLQNWGARNIFTGAGAGAALTLGADNAFFGWNAGATNAVAGCNTFIGSEAGANITTGGNNAFAGYRSGYQNTTGINNAFFGPVSGRANTTGLHNVFIGGGAGSN